jgi:acyl dehydratase
VDLLLIKNLNPIRFGRGDLDLFSSASHDRNPLHLSEAHARRTPFGEPVACGVLGVLRTLGGVAARRADELEDIAVNFRHPLFLGVDYRLDVDPGKRGRFQATISDGGRPMLTATFVDRSKEGRPLAQHLPGGPGDDSGHRGLRRPPGVRPGETVEEPAPPLSLMVAPGELGGFGQTGGDRLAKAAGS